VLLVAALLVAASQPAGANDATLLDGLRQGGFVIYFRHADTDHKQRDVPPLNLDDCTTQRNLTDRGREHARAIGAAIRALGIPIGTVLASPLCRCVETANLAFGAAELSYAVREGGPLPPGSTGRYDPLRALLSTVPPAGSNTVIVGHGYPLYTLIGGQYLDEGEAAVVRPDGAGFKVVVRVGLKEWRELGR
jgi:phosphohistidine phosphatase SixA